MARWIAAGHGLSTLMRLLLERAAAQAAGARRSASDPLPRIRGDALAAGERCRAGAGVASIRAATALRVGLRAAVDARGRYGAAHRSGGAVLLRLRPRPAPHC